MLLIIVNRGPASRLNIIITIIINVLIKVTLNEIRYRGTLQNQ